MAKARTGLIEPGTEQPAPSTANLPGNRSRGAMSAALRVMAPQVKEPGPAPLDQIPSGPAGINETTSARQFPTPAPSNVLSGASTVTPQKPEVAKTLDEMKAGAMSDAAPAALDVMAGPSDGPFRRVDVSISRTSAGGLDIHVAVPAPLAGSVGNLLAALGVKGQR